MIAEQIYFCDECVQRGGGKPAQLRLFGWQDPKDSGWKMKQMRPGSDTWQLVCPECFVKHYAGDTDG